MKSIFSNRLVCGAGASGSLWCMSIFCRLLCAVLVMGLLACSEGSSGGDDGDSGSSGQWGVVSVYYYDYEGGLLTHERDDNNNDGYIDETYAYTYDDEDRVISYDVHYDSDDEVDATGTYTYNDEGLATQLVEVDLESGEERTWTYTYDSDGYRLTYHLEDEDGNEENGTYTRNANGDVTALTTEDGRWTYLLDDDGNRVSYDYDEGKDGTIDRMGDYFYNGVGDLIRLENSEMQ